MNTIGLDLGQRQDHTAIAVIEKDRDVLLVRTVERVMLGTPWSRVVERVRHIATHPRMRGNCALAVDATGVGAPIVDMLRNANLGCEIAAVTITSGDRETETAHGWNVPKRDLMTALQLGLEEGEVRLAGRMKDIGSLIRELIDVRVAGERIGADKSGQHDDLVIAVALAVWKARHKKKYNFCSPVRIF